MRKNAPADFAAYFIYARRTITETLVRYCAAVQSRGAFLKFIKNLNNINAVIFYKRDFPIKKRARVPGPE